MFNDVAYLFSSDNSEILYSVSLSIYRRPYLKFFRQNITNTVIFFTLLFIILITFEFSLVVFRKLELGYYMITTFCDITNLLVIFLDFNLSTVCVKFLSSFPRNLKLFGRISGILFHVKCYIDAKSELIDKIMYLKRA